MGLRGKGVIVMAPPMRDCRREPARDPDRHQASNSAIDSTWLVCGNMSSTPARVSR